MVGYRGLQGDQLTLKVADDLASCGLRERQLHSRMQDYQDRNSFSAFLLPMVVNLVLLVIFWATTLLPHGISGMLDYLNDGGTLKISIAAMFPRIAADAAPTVWALLGAYFYVVTVIVRRWMQSDLTTSVIWKLDVRLVVTFILGLLLTHLAAGPERDLTAIGPYAAACAFTVGIVPDVFLRWTSQQLKRLGNVDSDLDGRLFAPSDLQRKIRGMSFWQVDRLADEGIESVQDLAMKDIPTLLITMRFDTPLLLSWVDRALLCDQVGELLPIFQRAFVNSATAFMSRAEAGGNIDALLRALASAENALRPADTLSGATGAGAEPGITTEQLANMLCGLRHGPNPGHLQVYWSRVNGYPPVGSQARHLPEPRIRDDNVKPPIRAAT